MKNDTTQENPPCQEQLQQYRAKRHEVDLSIEVVLLVVGGLFFLLFGALLFMIDRGMLPYSEGSMYGLFVILVSMQIITMGKTPFGDLLRSWLVVMIGLFTAMLGTLAIFYPGYLAVTIRVLAGLIVLVTGVLGLLQLFTAKDKARVWIKVPGILQQLTIACILVYGIEMMLGIITLLPGIIPNLLTAILCLIFGVSLLFLAWCIHMVHRQYPLGDGKEAPITPPSTNGFCLLKEASLTMGNTFNAYQGVLMILLGFLVLFITLGIFPSFNSDGQIGLLLVLTSLQLLALGQFVGSQVTRSWLVVSFGLLCASAGIFSCIVPGILAGLIQPLLGLQNILTGVLLLGTQIIAPTLYGIRHPPAEPVVLPPIIKRLFLVLAITGIVTILFGINTIAPVLLPNLLGMIAYAVLIPLLIITMGLLTLITISVTQRLQQGAETAP
ncbi:MAG TPA: hypothetical protein PK154_03035 [Methanoregulaceae archaeon]|jgi:uncharacterized membrane protein HdeD (DUF308 family)|nr:hypothetical protein [Methanoregulaceae archaeon]HOB58679.1 hypothetical protein [Methanoregulaceae archaeon]HOH81379.1 hypothetical protein [Methanoregulaceae archaeon]HPW10069.1 hypothetical protein [Methanoregulaceae archaeon]